MASDIVPSNFDDYSRAVAGFQDFFTESAAAMQSNYTEVANGAVAAVPSGDFTLDTSNQVLDINGGAGNPNKLLYSGATYDSSNQTVLAEIAVTDDPGGGSQSDGWRGGVATVSSPATGGGGINQLFRTLGNDATGGQGAHTNLLDDNIAWGPVVGANLAFDSSPLTYYWVKLTTTAGGNSITGELWPADGTTPESAAATSTWSAQSQTGLAGLVSDSGGNGTFAVNYLLIEAAGLPSITAGVPTPEPTSIGLLGLAAASLLTKRPRRP